MSYPFYVAKRNPFAVFNLDDSYPYHNAIGSGLTATKKTGSTDPTTATALVSGAAYSTVFKSGSIGQFEFPLFEVDKEQETFVLEAWVLPIPKTTTGDQQILSHDGVYDGLVINGKTIKFITKYTSQPDSVCSYEMPEYMLAHVVGIHTFGKDELYVNNVLVDSSVITDEQKKAGYSVSGNGYLYCGASSSNQEIAVNGVAFYNSIDSNKINQNYAAGIMCVGQDNVAPQYKGQRFDLGGATTSLFFNKQWSTKEDWKDGLKTNVEYGSDSITPYLDINDTSIAGSWIVNIDLEQQGDTSIYGVFLQWYGSGITVETSLDGASWVTATNGALVSSISNGYNPTGKDLQIRVSFAGGVLDDTANLQSLRAIGFKNNDIVSPTIRPVTITHPAIVREDHEPNLYRDDNGVVLNNGTLTIGTDSSPDPSVVRTVEVWIKPLSGTPTISGTYSTKYRNGAVDSSLPVGQWSCLHWVGSADITAAISISGQAIVGQVVLYPTALTASQVAHLYKSYVGTPAVRISDPSAIEITEPVMPPPTDSHPYVYKIYSHDWTIESS